MAYLETKPAADFCAKPATPVGDHFNGAPAFDLNPNGCARNRLSLRISDAADQGRREGQKREKKVGKHSQLRQPGVLPPCRPSLERLNCRSGLQLLPLLVQEGWLRLSRKISRRLLLLGADGEVIRKQRSA